MTSKSYFEKALAVGVFVIAVLANVVLWGTLQRADESTMIRAMDIEAQHISESITRTFNYQVSALQRLADRFVDESLSEAEWRKAASLLKNDFSHFQAIEWADTDYFIRWIEPLQGNEAALDFNVAFNPERLAALTRSRTTGAINSTQVINLQQGGKGVAVYLPIAKGADFKGFIIGVFHVDSLLQSLITQTDTQKFALRVYEHNQQIFGPATPVVPDELTSTIQWAPLHFNWRLELSPRPVWMELYRDDSALLVLLGGILGSLLLAFAVYLWASNLRQKEYLLEANQALRQEAASREQAEKDLSHAIHHDALTGLPNREFFLEDLQQALVHAKRSGSYLAVVIIDLDQFKNINDTLGHPVGDALIQQAGRRLSAEISFDHSLARVGGDEFMCLLKDISSVDEVISCVNQFRQCFSRAFKLLGHEIYSSISMGIALFPEGGSTAKELVQNADVALYKAKDAGRDGYQFFTTGMQAAALRRLELDGMLRDPAVLDQLRLVYQPKISLADGQIIGAEVLLRWNHPEKGFISPAEFIPLAEETGMIRVLGLWVFEQACQQLAAWADTPLVRLPLAINLSAIQLTEEDLTQNLSRLTASYGLRPQQFELELTEEVFIENIRHNQATLQELRNLGFSLAIDDFGVGYSSLAYLKHFPISSVKIDRTFVSDLENDKDDQVIVNAVIAMAHNLHFKVVAEGIETVDQMNYLRQQNCDEGQGFLFARPLAADEFHKLFTDNSGRLTPDPLALKQ